MKRALIIFVAFCSIVAFIVCAYAANTVTSGAGTIKIVPDGSTDWLWNTNGGFSNSPGIKVYSIQFNPSAANDILILHNGGIDDIAIFDSGPAGGTAPIIKYYPGGKYIRLVLDASDCTFDTAANASIYIEYSP